MSSTMIKVLCLAAFVALAYCDAEVGQKEGKEGDSPDKQWWYTTTWRWPETETTSESRPEVSSDSPGRRLSWRYQPGNESASVGSQVRFRCSAYLNGNSRYYVHFAWLREAEDGSCTTLFQNYERWDAPRRMSVSLYGTDYYEGSDLSIYGVEESDFGKYTCQVHAEYGENELREHAHLSEAEDLEYVCQPGWSKSGESCYAKFDNWEGNTWQEANSYCDRIAVNASLATISDSTENRFLDSLMRYNEEAWIGYYYHQNYRNYRWIDGNYRSYTNWDLYYPKYDKDEGCVLIDYYGRWTHKSCSNSTTSFICKAPAYGYVSADRDDSGCSWNWAGYRYYCYRVYDGPSRDCRYDVHSSSQNVYIESPDENDFIVKLIKEDSNHQAAGTVRLHAKHDAYTGWEWQSYWSSGFPFKNWAADDKVDQSSSTEGIDLDIETGVWRGSTSPGSAWGTVCKTLKSFMAEETEENKKDGNEEDEQKEE